MISEEYYNKILLELVNKMEGCSDAVSVRVWPYENFVTAKGELDLRQKGFKVSVNIAFFGIQTSRMMEIISDATTRIKDWMKELGESIYFIEHSIKSTSGENSRIELVLRFDKAADMAIRLLSRMGP